MQTIKYGGFKAILVGQLLPSSYSSEYKFIAFADNTTSARAVGAAMLDGANRKKASEIKLGRDAIHLIKHEKYRLFTVQSKKRVGHGVTMAVYLVHTDFTTQGGESDELLFLVDPESDENDPPPGFYQRFKQAVRLPMLPEWEQWLWDEGREKINSGYISTGYRYGRSASMSISTGQVTPIREWTAEGARIWAVTTKQKVWLDVIRHHHNAGVRIKKIASDLYEGGGWQVEQDGRHWRAKKNGELLLDDQSGDIKTPPQAHYSNDLNDMLAIISIAAGERLVIAEGA